MKVALPSMTFAKPITRARLSLLVSMTVFLSSSMEFVPFLFEIQHLGESLEEWLEVVSVAELEPLPAPARAGRVDVWRDEASVDAGVLVEPVAHGGGVRDDVSLDEEVHDRVDPVLLC